MFNKLISYLQQTLPDIWQQRSLAARCLLPLSWLYQRIASFKKQTALANPKLPLPVPVLVIGNVIAGGAGKTPVCIAIAKYFQSLGLLVGVVSRGYGRNTSDCMVLDSNSSYNATQVGDEPLLIHQRTGAPVAVCAQRYTAAQALLQQVPNIKLLICDDGLQHWSLPRDGEICVFDERGIGNGWLIPAGPLRESWFRDCTFYIQTQEWQNAAVTPKFPEHKTVHQARRVLEQNNIVTWAQNNQVVHAIAGIARPNAFFTMLRQAGLVLGKTIPLPDHSGIEQLQQAIENIPDDGNPIVCTEKDAVKLDLLRLHNQRIHPIQLKLVFNPQFFEALNMWWQKIKT